MINDIHFEAGMYDGIEISAVQLFDPEFGDSYYETCNNHPEDATWYSLYLHHALSADRERFGAVVNIADCPCLEISIMIARALSHRYGYDINVLAQVEIDQYVEVRE